jgi:uncharacterized protein YaiI (UPF0178 family)
MIHRDFAMDSRVSVCNRGVMKEENDQTDRSIVILVDADACPVKPEIYRVAERYGIRVVLVANSYIAIPRDNNLVERVIVPSGLDVADDWIAERSRPGSIVITADIPLASRAVAAGAAAIAPNGKTHTQSNIGSTLATRNLMDSHRSAVLSALDLAVVRLKRHGFHP